MSSDQIEFTWQFENWDFIWSESFQRVPCRRPVEVKETDEDRPVEVKETDEEKLDEDNSPVDRITYMNTYRSPLISAGKPRHTVFYLNIYAHTSCMDEHLLSHELVRLHGSFKGHFESKIQLVGLNDKKIASVPWFSEFGDGLNVDKHFLPQAKLTLHCLITFSDPPHLFTSGLRELNRNMNTLFTRGDYSDLTLYTSDEKFPVHKFLLQKRIPKLLIDLGLNENSEIERVKMDKISTPVLHTLLQYIYSGEMREHPLETLAELYQTVEKYQVERFNSSHLMKKTPIITQLNVIRKIICWKTDHNDESKYFNAPILSEEVYFDYALFLVQVFLEITVQETLIYFTIKCLSSGKNDILMSCITSSGLNNRNLNHGQAQMFRFSTLNGRDEFYLEQKLSYSYKDIGRSLYLQLNLAVSNGLYSHSILGLLPTQPESVSLFGKGLLCFDMKNLGDETFFFKDRGDVSLCFGLGILQAHKAILSAWSPVFHGMFQADMLEKKSDVANISNVEFQTGLRLLQFMYTGLISKAGYEEDVKLYTAADKFLVMSLRGKCSSFLASHLTADNALEMLVLANRHSDWNLLGIVRRYLATNPEDILNSREWLSFVDEHPGLAS